MTTTSKIGGVTHSKSSGTYSLFLREKGVGIRTPNTARNAELIEALRNNGIYVANLTAALRGLPKDIAGALAATALMMAVDSTKHDSSRAAANWDLAVSGKMAVRTNLDPLMYGESGDRFGRIGKKGTAGRAASLVRSYKKMFYGLRQVPGMPGLWQAARGGILYEALGIGQAGTPRVDLYNPIAGDLNVRRAGDREHQNASALWHSYAYYAFGGSNPNTFLPGLETAKEMIGSGYIPMRVLAIGNALKNVAGRGGIPRV